MPPLWPGSSRHRADVAGGLHRCQVVHAVREHTDLDPGASDAERGSGLVGAVRHVAFGRRQLVVEGLVRGADRRDLWDVGYRFQLIQR